MRLLGIAILSGILCLFYPQVVRSAEMTVVDNSIFVKTDAYEVLFVDGVITQLANKLTEEVYTLPLGIGDIPTGIGGRSGLLKRNSDFIWTDRATLTEARKISPLKAEIVFRHGQNEIRLFIAVDEDTGDLLIEQEGFSDTEGVYGIQWGCGNLDTQNLNIILPAQGGQVIDAASPSTSGSFDYPEHWEAQLAIIQAEQGGFYVRGTDETFQFKALHYEKDIESFALNFETQNQAPFDALTSAKSVTWRLNTYIGDWRVPARQYRDWMAQTFNPRKLTEMPAWVSEIGLVIIYHGQEIALLKHLATQTDPTKTLLYLTQWRKDDYDTNYPDYTASENFGGFLDAARQYGFRVMLHTNFPGVAPYHRLYATLQQYQFRDRWSGNPIGWFWDRIEEPGRHAFINPASSEFRKILVQELTDVSQKYQVDAFHLDVSLIAKNDANGLIEGLNSAQGNVQLHTELTEAMPQVVFGGEGLHEVTFFRESFAQRLIYSLDIKPHPISTFLFSPYTLLYGHLGLPNPDIGPELYQEYLHLYENWGVLPTLRLWSVEQLEADHLGTQRLLSLASVWQELGFKPNFETDWGTGTLFQYVGKGGEIATLQETDGRVTLTLPEEGIGYERIFGVTQVKTERSLPHWHAYNQTALLGLNPKKPYLLSDTPRDFSQVHINALPEGVSVTESRVTENAALFRLERTNVSQEIDLLSQFHLVRTGIVLNAEELPRQRGATFQAVEASIAGVRKTAINAHPPYQGISGDTFGEWTLSLPDSPHIRLEFDIGLQDGSAGSDGVTFIVAVQGDEIFRQHYNEQRWEHISLDLTPYRNQQAMLRWTTTPGPVGNGAWDWAIWGTPKIFSEPTDSMAEVGFFLPNEPIQSFPDTVKHQGDRQYTLETELPAQMRFFFNTPEQVEGAYNLRDTQFVAGLQYDGIFQLGSVLDSGQRTALTANGVSKETISAHPPPNGQTVLQFLLSLPHTQTLTFSFSMGLPDRSCSLDGLFFKVFLNGEMRYEHFAFNTPGWVDAEISLSEYTGETVLLELVTDSVESATCDWAHWAELLITAKEAELKGDVNQDGIVNILDIVLVAQHFGQKPPSDPRVDVNNDGQVNVLDLVLVAEQLGENVAASPVQGDIVKSDVSTEAIIAVQRSLRVLEAVPEKSDTVQRTIQFLRLWLEKVNQNVSETRLLPNYPNPFNPETWIPYQLAESGDVSVKIYDIGGHLVRTLSIGFKPVGYYLTQKRAVHWDGRNEAGEPVSSGVYFLKFLTGTFSATQRVVIVK